MTLNESGTRKSLEAILARYDELKAREPEMSGTDFAFDHGWISGDEWDDADRRSREIQAEYSILDAQLDACERQDRPGFRKFLEDLRAALIRKEANPEGHLLAGCLQDARKSLEFRLGLTTARGHDLKWAIWISLRISPPAEA